jgi:hypothetical protein
LLVVAASGKRVGGIERGGVDTLRKLVAAYRRLPVADRRPVLEKTSRAGNPDEMPPSPPPGGLALIIYTTALEKTRNGELIRARNLMAPGPSWVLETPITLNDLHWLTHAESQALIPQDPKTGQTGRFPDAVQRRLFRLSGYDWSSTYQNDAPPLRSGDLTWTVQKVSPSVIQMRIEGFSRVGGKPEEVRHCSCKNPKLCNHWGCDLRYLGFIKIDRSKQAIVDLRIVALGETTTRYDRRTLSNDSEVHTVPSGLVIELASDCPANRGGWNPLMPYRMRHFRINYWNLGMN